MERNDTTAMTEEERAARRARRDRARRERFRARRRRQMLLLAPFLAAGVIAGWCFCPDWGTGRRGQAKTPVMFRRWAMR